MKDAKLKKNYFQQFQTFVVDRFVPRDVTEKDSLLYWRARILFALLFAALVLCSFAIVAALALAIKENVWSLAVFDFLAYMICLGLLLSRRLRYEIRSATALLMCYAVGMAVIVLVGPLSGGPVWLFAFAVLVGVLLGSKAAIGAVILNGISLTIIAWLISTGRFGQTFPFFNTTQAMVAAGVNFIISNAIAAISVAVLVKGLVTTHEKEKALATSLEQEQARLLRAKNDLELEVEERKQAEKALQKSEEKYRLLVEDINDVIYRTDQNGILTYISPIAKTLAGYDPAELIGQHFIKIIYEEDLELLAARFEELLSGIVKPTEYRIVNKSGEPIWVRSSSKLTYENENVVGVQGVLTNIAEEKKLQVQLQQAQKMESIGTLAGGIAHDFNNLLMGIQGRTSLMSMNLESSHPHFEHLQGIEESVKSAAALTRQLLGFARGGKYESKPTDLNDLVSKSSEMFGRTKKEIGIHCKNQKDIWTVEVDRTQIEQVLLNLYVNAWQAMSGTGKLILETENVTLDEAYAKPYAVNPGRFVKITVTDTGIGMDKATQRRIFDPFFTTREKSTGTGLGLASVYGIIKNHGGIITVQSRKGKGATFNVFLPVTEKEVVREKELSQELVLGTESVLLVDDEKAITEVGQKLLEALGYSVFLAKNGKEAIETYENNESKIDIVILDMIMPEMGGAETYDRLKEIDPEIKVLLSSGYSIDGLAKTILAKGCNGFMQKPFGLKDLSTALRDILEAN